MRRESVWRPVLLLAALMTMPLQASAWEEEVVMRFILANNPLLRAYRSVTTEYVPPSDTLNRILEYTSLYGSAGIGGTDYRDDPFILTAGVQIRIPLASTQERRNHAQKAVEEVRAIDELRRRVMTDIAALRQHEADMAATEQRLRFYSDKSGWLQKRVDEGYGEVEKLWEIGQKLNEERSAREKLRILIDSQRYQVAHYAGRQWQALLEYLEGKSTLLDLSKVKEGEHG